MDLWYVIKVIIMREDYEEYYHADGENKDTDTDTDTDWIGLHADWSIGFVRLIDGRRPES